MRETFWARMTDAGIVRFPPLNGADGHPDDR